MASADINDKDLEAIADVVRSGRLALGPKVVEFEKKIADYIGIKHAIAVNSGTAALHLILKGLGLQKNQEVIVPSFTFAASVNAILYEGGRPVFADIDPLTFNIDPADVESKITKNTWGVMVVDVFGYPAEWDALNSLAQRHRIKLVDDSCEALGAEYKGTKIGRFGEAAAFAFYPNKQITTGEGGMIVTNQDSLSDALRSYRNQGRGESGQWLEHLRLGYNYRLNEMSAALGCSQLNRINELLENRRRVAQLYNERLAEHPCLTVPRISDNVRMSWFVYVITLNDGLDRGIFISELQKENIPSRPYFSPIHRQPYYLSLFPNERWHLPVTEDISSRTVALPFFGQMKASQVDQVIKAIDKISTRLSLKNAPYPANSKPKIVRLLSR